jgi:hypothetical protein
MIYKILLFLISVASFQLSVYSQNSEKIYFNDKDSANDYYLAIRPLSGSIRGVQVLFRSFVPPEFILPETKLQNVGFANDLLTVIASLNQDLCANPSSMARISMIIRSIEQKFSVDTARFALAGFEYAGNIVLRYTEMAYQQPAQFPIRPKAVFVINCPVDLIGLWHWSEKAARTNYNPGTAADGKYIVDALTKENGTLSENLPRYIDLSPFYRDATAPGNEQYLKNVALRLYYDTDINWYLKIKKESYDDTYLPDGSELINRLQLMGDTEAEFVAAKQPGIRSNGLRNADSWSIVDEVDCIQWLKRKLDIFDPNTYTPVYNLPSPKNWDVERFQFPIEFAPQIPYKGIEDVRFTPGWGNKNSEEYWSYCFLWWLDPKTPIDASSLQDDLQQYYSGLVGRNIAQRKIPKEKLVPVLARIKKINSLAGDAETFSGTVSTLDYMEQEPMLLNALIHVKTCDAKNHKAVFLEISPKPASHPVWGKMNEIYAGFQCSN